MCRDEVVAVMQRMTELKRAGVGRTVCLVKEDLDDEVAEFQKKYWKGEVFLDLDKRFYSALGGGKVWRPMDAGFVLAMINPWDTSRAKMNIKSMQMPSNDKGEGFIAGGCYVIAPDGSSSYRFLEETLGDKADLEAVILAVASASAFAKRTAAQFHNELPARKGESASASDKQTLTTFGKPDRDVSSKEVRFRGVGRKPSFKLAASFIDENLFQPVVDKGACVSNAVSKIIPRFGSKGCKGSALKVIPEPDDTDECASSSCKMPTTNGSS